ncbi:MAG: leucine-rich repeat domain-containing protein [Flavobacteriales bacterium]|nr:leucine-rich repeat domain-containing protein [Flavobacteriales bacterium]
MIKPKRYKSLVKLLVLGCFLVCLQTAYAQLLTEKELKKATKFSWEKAQGTTPEKVLKLKLKEEEVALFLEKIETYIYLQSLDLNNCNLSELPKAIFKLTNLQELIISNNPITVIPSEIGELKNLKWLYATFIKATTLPSSIKELRKLHTLFLWGSEITYFPVEFLELKATLKVLNIRSIKMSKKAAKELKKQLSETRVRYSYRCDCSF